MVNVDELREALVFARDKALPVFVLGGGSNVVLHQDINRVCLHICIKGYEQVGSLIHVGAGEPWHDTVMQTLRSELFGLENLSLIPGSVGAAPIQNIGAYGVELAERVFCVTFVDIHTGDIRELSAPECEFAYRDSIFKTDLKDQAIITSVSLLLDETFQPRVEYSGIKTYLEAYQLPLTAARVSQAVCDLRRSKLPDPDKFGNVGSFFKNPVVTEDVWRKLQALDRKMPGHEENDGRYKLSAAYLIEQAGLKGKTLGGAMVSTQHALVIQNNGGATGADVLNLAREVQQSIKSRFDIVLDIEPRLVPA